MNTKQLTSILQEYNISMEQFQDLSKELEITETALGNFFEILKHNQVSIEMVNITVQKIASQYNLLVDSIEDLKTNLIENLKSDHSLLSQLIDEASLAIHNCDVGECQFARAEELLTHAKRLSYENSKRHSTRTKNRQERVDNDLSIAARCVALNGLLKEIQLIYKDAGEYYEEASRLIPRKENLMRVEFLNNAGSCFQEIGFHDKTQFLLKQAIAIQDRLPDSDRDILELNSSLNNLMLSYITQEKYTEAKPLCVRLLTIQEKSSSEDKDQSTRAMNFYILASLCRTQGEFIEALSFYKQAREIYEGLPESKRYPVIAYVLNGLAETCSAQEDYTQAESLYQQIVAIHEGMQDKQDLSCMQVTLNNQASLYVTQQKYAEAESVYFTLLNTQKRAFGEDHPALLDSLDGLATLYYMQGQYDKAEQFRDRLLDLSERLFGVDNEYTQNYKKEFSQLFSKMDKEWK